MTTRKAIAVAIRELSSQIACEDISDETRIELQKAHKKLLKFIKVVYDS